MHGISNPTRTIGGVTWFCLFSSTALQYSLKLLKNIGQGAPGEEWKYKKKKSIDYEFDSDNLRSYESYIIKDYQL